jgi:hypothetical protein
LKILPIPPNTPIRSARFAGDGTETATAAPRRTLSLGLTVLQPDELHGHGADQGEVKPCCRGKQQPAATTGLSFTVLTDSPNPLRPANAVGTLTIVQPQPHKTGGSCCGGHKPEGNTLAHQPASPVKTLTGGSCCHSGKPDEHTAQVQPGAPAPTTWIGKLVHAVKAVAIWFGHLFGSFFADLKLLVSGKSQ